MTSIALAISAIKQAIAATRGMVARFDELKINQGLMLAELHSSKASRNIRDYEYKVFSQCGEDGIIQRLISVVKIERKTFVEFGVEDFMESNCRFLLMKDNWSGFVIDGSATNIARLKRSYFYWKYDLVALGAFITQDNINEILSKSGFEADLGILSIDLDGNDYYILKAITFFRPRILICEYNAVFGVDRKISVVYDKHFIRERKHYSRLYWGASLTAFTHLARQMGYSLVGTASAGGNAFFVRSDLLNDQIDVVSAEEAFSPAKHRDSRDEEGKLSYLAGHQRLALLKGLPVLNVETDTVESL